MGREVQYIRITGEIAIESSHGFGRLIHLVQCHGASDTVDAGGAANMIVNRTPGRLLNTRHSCGGMSRLREATAEILLNYAGGGAQLQRAPKGDNRFVRPA
jgi:hypothetical protein